MFFGSKKNKCPECGSRISKGLNFCPRCGCKVANDSGSSKDGQRNPNADECFNTGLMYMRGDGVDKDYKKAMEWYLKAAEQNDFRAQCNVGELYRCGQGVEQDYQKAMEWFLKAAEQNYDIAQNKLGELYLYGFGTYVDVWNDLEPFNREDDCKKAFEWFSKAANQNNPDAQANLGVLYEEGLGVEMDCLESEKWFIKAANQNNALAQYRMSCICMPDKLGKDCKEALVWALKASKNDIDGKYQELIEGEIEVAIRSWFCKKTKKAIEESDMLLETLDSMDCLEKDKKLIKDIIKQVRENHGAPYCRKNQKMKYDAKKNGLVEMDVKEFESKFTSLITQYPTAVTEEKLLQSLLKDFFPKQIELCSSLLLLQGMNISVALTKVQKVDTSFMISFLDSIPADAIGDKNVLTYALIVWCKCYGGGILNKTCEMEFA